MIGQQLSMKGWENSCCVPSRSILPLEAKTLRPTKPKVAGKRSINSTCGLLGVMVGRAPAPATPEFSERPILPSGDMATAHEQILIYSCLRSLLSPHRVDGQMYSLKFYPRRTNTHSLIMVGLWCNSSLFSATSISQANPSMNQTEAFSFSIS